MNTLTIFTPTYNRKKLLHRCYESLKRQTNKDFIWMIIDDGSTDGTNIDVEEWISDCKSFIIEYYYKENGGLHTAYNEAISRIETELCVCIDSDDYMPDDAVEKIINCWNEKGSSNVAGIVGLDYSLDCRVIGDMLPNQDVVNLIDLLVGKYALDNGDRTNVVRTELYKKYAPIEGFLGEKYFNPHYLHLKISQHYDFLVLNENLRFVEYLPTGMSSSIWKQYLNSPNSFAEIRKLYLSFPNTSLKFRFKNSIHLVSSYILARKFPKVIKESKNMFLTILAIPFGILLALCVRLKGN